MLAETQWLILLIPALLWLFKLGMPSRKLTVIRFLILLLSIIALCSPQIKMPGRKGVLVVVADRSSSMPKTSEESMKEAIGILANTRPTQAKLGVISYGTDPEIEMTPSKLGFPGFSSKINPSASNLNQALNEALSLIPSDLTGSILVLSDGKWTGDDPKQAAYLASKRNIPINYRLISQSLLNDVAITEMNTPQQTEPGESFLITTSIYSPKNQKAKIILKAGSITVAKTVKILNKGNNRLSFQYTAQSPCVIEFKLIVKTQQKDSVTGNNVARGLTEVTGNKPVLIVTNRNYSALKNILTKAGIRTVTAKPQTIHWALEFLLGYSAVIVDNVSANQLTSQGMSLIDAWIKNFGGGLFLLGGGNSFGPGGYYQSRLENALPVTMELRSESRKMSVAIAIVLDRSGSMSAPTQGGRTKMDLANMAAANTLDMMTKYDELAVFAVDTTPHPIVPLTKLTDAKSIRDKILRIESNGGGIYVYEGLLAASKVLLKAKSKTRHIILFSDARDSEQPGRYWELLQKDLNANITCSVIGLGTEADCDANILKKIANEGQGRIFFTHDPAELPRLFAQDTFSITKSAYIEDDTPISSKAGLRTLAPAVKSFASSVGGYNLCYIKPEATIGAATTDDNKAPIIAAWSYGLGRTACYMADIDGKLAGNFPGSESASKVFLAITEWLRANKNQEINNMVVTQKLVKGKWELNLNLDPDREEESFNKNPVIQVISSFPNREPEKKVIPLKWKDADTLTAGVNLTGNETIVSGLSLKKGRIHHLPPICMPFSQEFNTANSGDGSDSLKELAKTTGGKDSLNLTSIWQDIPKKVQYKDITDYLIFTALLLFLLEIIERRTSLLSILIQKTGKISIPKFKTKSRAPVPETIRRKKTTSVTSSQEVVKPTETPEAKPKEEKKPSMFSALKSAKKNADKRTKK